MSFFDKQEEDDGWGKPPAKEVQKIESVSDVTTIIRQETAEQISISSNLTHLHTVMQLSSDLCSAVYELKKYVPPDAKDNKFWSETMIPTMIKALVGDITARDLVFASAGKVKALALAINESSNAIKLTGGSPATIIALKETVNEYFKAIEDVKSQVLNFKSDMIKAFADNAKNIMEVVGPKVFEQVCDFDQKIAAARNEIISMNIDQAKLIADYKSLTFALDAARSRFYGREQARKMTETRDKDIQTLVDSESKKMSDIPRYNSETVTEESGFWFWKSRRTRVIQVENKDASSEIQHYQSMIDTRNKQLKQLAEETKDRSIAEKEAQEDVAKYEKAVKEVEERLALYKPGGTIGRTIKEKEDVVDGLLKKRQITMTEIDKISVQYGLRGNVLVDCLSQIVILMKSDKDHTLMLAPLANILEAVKGSTNIGLRMITQHQSTTDDVKAGVTLLMRWFGLLQDTSLKVEEVVSFVEIKDVKALTDAK